MTKVGKLRILLITLTLLFTLGLVPAGCGASADNTPTPTNVPTSTPTPEPAATPAPTDHQGAAEQGLEGAHPHVPPADKDREVAMHHWMALLAIEVDDIPDAVHHVAHINALVTGEHLRQMEEVPTMLEGGQLHDAEHTIQGMLAGTAVLDLTPEAMHLQLALASVGVEDAANAIHHTEHFLDLSIDQERKVAEEVIDLLRAERFPEAEHELEELLGEE